MSRSAKEATAKTSLSDRLTLAGAVLLLVFHAAFALRSMTTTSPTVDEVTFIGAAHNLLRTGDFSAAGDHPMLLMLWQGLPLLTVKGLQSTPHDRPFFTRETYSTVKFWKYGIDFLAANAAQVDTIVFRARLSIVLLSLMLGLVVFKWSHDLYGNAAALVALTLYVFCPNVLAAATLATLDLGFTFFTFLTTFLFWKLITQPSLRYLLATGVSLGLTLTTKTNAPIVVFVLALLAVTALRPEAGSWQFVTARYQSAQGQRFVSFTISYLAVLAIAWLTVNLVYGFRGTFLPLQHYIPRLATAGQLAMMAGRLPIPFPDQFLFAVLKQLQHASGGHVAYLFGEISNEGWPYYHAVTFILKVPGAMLLLLSGAIVYSFEQRNERRLVSTDELFLLIPSIAIFLIISLFAIQVGFRHILPVMPFLFVYVSKLGQLIGRQHRWSTVVLTFAGIWYVTASLSIYPHYLSYFNELGGGPEKGYQYLVDSNIDWGQDLKGLKTYMSDHEIDRVYLSFFGSADPAFYDISYTYLPSVGLRPSTPDGKWWYEPGYVENCEPVEGVVAVSVTILQGVLLDNPDCFSWLREREPIGRVGYSILVFDTRHDTN